MDPNCLRASSVDVSMLAPGTSLKSGVRILFKLLKLFPGVDNNGRFCALLLGHELSRFVFLLHATFDKFLLDKTLFHISSSVLLMSLSIFGAMVSLALAIYRNWEQSRTTVSFL